MLKVDQILNNNNQVQTEHNIAESRSTVSIISRDVTISSLNTTDRSFGLCYFAYKF